MRRSRLRSRSRRVSGRSAREAAAFDACLNPTQAPARNSYGGWRISARRTADGHEPGSLVQPARAQRLEIDADELETRVAQSCRCAVADLEEARQLIGGDLDAGDVAVIAHAEFAQPELAQRHLALR